MKINTIKKRWILPALSCAALAMTSQSHGQVVVYFEQVGSDVTATWTGSIDLGVWDGDQGTGNGDFLSDDRDLVMFFPGGAAERYLGTSSSTGLQFNLNNFSYGPTGTPETGGFLATGQFYVPGLDDNIAPASSIHDMSYLSQLWLNKTLSELNADAFNNTLAFTSNVGGTVRYTTGPVGIPEPASTALLGIGALALIVRKRR